MIYISMDDTDSLESRGTGTLARTIAKELSENYPVYGVTRHQLYKHPDIPYTSHNTCAVIQVEGAGEDLVDELFGVVKDKMLADFVDGSDPGLAVAEESQIKPSLVAFGCDAKSTILNQKKARGLASNLNIKLEGLGGTEDGVIGTMAGIGLASTQNDGRFLRIGLEDITGSLTVEKLFDAGVDSVYTLDGRSVTEGLVSSPDGKLVKPCPVNGEVVLFVEEQDGVLKAVNRG